jgi:hypothetical protein
MKLQGRARKAQQQWPLRQCQWPSVCACTALLHSTHQQARGDRAAQRAAGRAGGKGKALYRSVERAAAALTWCGVSRDERQRCVRTNSRFWQKRCGKSPTHRKAGLFCTLLRTIRSRNTTSDWRAASSCGLGSSIGCRQRQPMETSSIKVCRCFHVWAAAQPMHCATLTKTA